MLIKHIEVRPQNGGFVKIFAVVEGNIQTLAKLASEAVSKPYNMIIEPVRKKRTLTANAYYWVLLDELAKVLKANEKDLHRIILARYGETATDAQGTPIVFKMSRDINPRELGEVYVDPIDSHDGYVTYRVLKGSSELDSRAFAHLLDGLISECKELGIEVIPYAELQRLFEISQPKNKD